LYVRVNHGVADQSRSVGMSTCVFRPIRDRMSRETFNLTTIVCRRCRSRRTHGIHLVLEILGIVFGRIQTGITKSGITQDAVEARTMYYNITNDRGLFHIINVILEFRVSCNSTLDFFPQLHVVVCLALLKQTSFFF